MKGQIGLFHPYGVWIIFHSRDPPEILSLSSLFHFAPDTSEQEKLRPLESKTHIAFRHHSFSISWTFGMVLRHAMATPGSSACIQHALADLSLPKHNRQFPNEKVCIYTSLFAVQFLLPGKF